MSEEQLSFKTKEWCLPVDRVVIKRLIAEEALIDMSPYKLESYVAAEGQDIVLSIARYIACDHRTEHFDKTIVEYPATLWDHFKHSAIPTFSKWLHLTINMKQVNLELAATTVINYPTIPVLPGQEKVIYRYIGESSLFIRNLSRKA